MLDERLVSITDEALERGALQKGYELYQLLAVVASLDPKVIVEIGSDQGGTLHALRGVAPTADLVSIDLPQGPFSTGHPLNPPDSAVILQADSHDPATLQTLCDYLDGRLIDVLFIDGDHTYEGVKLDYLMYSPLVNGIIVLHDIVQHKDPVVGVHRLWHELSGEKTEFVVEPLDWGGIGVIQTESRVRDLNPRS